jgi:ribosome-binding factor A
MAERQRRAQRGDSLRAEGRARQRHARHGHLISETLQALVRDALFDPALDEIALTSIELSLDGQHLRVWFVLTDEGEDAGRKEAARAALERATGYLRVLLAERLSQKRVPQLHFEADPRAVEVDPCRD